MSTARLALRQAAFELRTFRRNRSGMLFTFAFPLIFLVVFGLNAKGNTETFNGAEVPTIQFFVPGILAYGVIGACYTNLAMRVVFARDTGVLKRVKGTPLPRIAYMAGQIGTSVIIGIIISAITLAVATTFYGVHLYAATSLAALVSLVVGAAAFCAIGLAVASIVPNADSAPGIVNFSIFPILFISDVFYSVADAPRWLQDIAGFFPIKHFANALQIAFSPFTTGTGFSGKDLLVLTAWGLAGSAFAIRRFRWESNQG